MIRPKLILTCPFIEDYMPIYDYAISQAEIHNMELTDTYNAEHVFSGNAENAAKLSGLVNKFVKTFFEKHAHLAQGMRNHQLCFGSV